MIPACHGEGVRDTGLPRRRGECSRSVMGRGDREQKWLFLFLVCKFLADQEHLDALPTPRLTNGLRQLSD